MNIFQPDKDTTLLLIDVQQGFDHPKWGVRNNPDAEERIGCLLEYWRTRNGRVIHVQHCSTNPESPLRPDRPGCEFKDIAWPKHGEIVVQKNVNSAFIGTNLEHLLRQYGVRSLVIAGLTTDHCVSTTTRMSGNLGFGNALMSDATATFDRVGPNGTHYPAELMHETALASLHREFATVMTTEELLRLMKDLD